MSDITLVLHNIRSTHNVGAIFRTAEGFGVSEIILTGYTPYPQITNDDRLPHIAQKLTTQIHKTALGAENLVPFRHFPTLEDWLNFNTKNEQLPLIGLEQSTIAINIKDFTPPAAYAVLLGEEVKGIEQRYLKQCQQLIEIPMMGKKESFNVSVATGIALYALTTNAERSYAT